MKNKRTTIIFIIAIIIFTTLLVPKTFQNDTFFAIAVGDLVLDNGIDMMEHFTWHENMSYCYSHWLFDIIIALINNFSGFTGIYVFTIIMANITSLTLFKVLTKRKNNELISFIVTLLTVYLGRSMFTGRAQVISFVLFIIEVFCIEQFLDNPKKRYIACLLIIPIIIANMHAAVWPMYFVMYLPYIAEYILSQMSLKKKYPNKEIYKKEPYKIIVEENKNVKKLIIVMLIAILTGFMTPIGDVPFTYMIKQLENNIVGSFISEMQPITPISSTSFMVLIIVYISIIAFTDTKIKLSESLFILGFLFMTLCSNRSIYYFIWICAIPLTRIINSFMCKYGENELDSAKKVLSKSKSLVILLICIIVCSIYLYTENNLGTQYVDETKYPVGASEYILNKLDIENIRLYNGYNYGSYLEMKGIPVFIDSRADIWCEEFNDTTVLEDESNLRWGIESYIEVFKKYDITHALVYKGDIIDEYISTDNNYKVIYSDENFVLYEHIL